MKGCPLRLELHLRELGPLLALASVAVLLLWPQAGAVVSAALLKGVVQSVAASGVSIALSGQWLWVGGLQIPWSDDCAGVAYFAIFPLVALWALLRVKQRCGIASVVVFPWLLALGVNVLRIASIALYRWWFAPASESPQTHLWFGFIWALPALWLLLPRALRQFAWVDALHLTAVLALVLPLLPSPGGGLILFATAVVLSARAARAERQPQRLVYRCLVGAWLLAAVWIALSHMESLWLPWLLLWPGGLNGRRLPWAAYGMLPATLSVVAMHGLAVWWLFGAWGGVTLRLAWRDFAARGRVALPPVPSAVGPNRRWAWALLVMTPFLALSLDEAHDHGDDQPAPSLQPQAEGRGLFALRLDRQPPAFRVDWISPQAGGRHHTLTVCMAYRGEHLHPVAGVAGVLTDGRVFRREYFLHQNQLLRSYQDYLLSTLWPGSGKGVHLVVSSAVLGLQPEAFATLADELALRVHEHQTSPLYEP